MPDQTDLTPQFDPAALRALLDAATPGPWSADAFQLKDDSDPFVQPLYICDGIKASQFAKDLALIVYLRNHAGGLLDERERLQVALDRTMTAMEVSNDEALRAEEKAAELRDGMAQVLDACEEAQRQRDEARAEVARLKAELEDARDALDAARSLLEDPEGTPLDEVEEFTINDDHGGYVPDVVLAICRGEIAPNSAGDKLFDFDEPLDEAAEESRCE